MDTNQSFKTSVHQEKKKNFNPQLNLLYIIIIVLVFIIGIFVFLKGVIIVGVFLKAIQVWSGLALESALLLSCC